jgi:hypothetical protein
MNEELLRRCLDLLSDVADETYAISDADPDDDRARERLAELTALTAEIRAELGMATTEAAS